MAKAFSFYEYMWYYIILLDMTLISDYPVSRRSFPKPLFTYHSTLNRKGECKLFFCHSNLSFKLIL